MAFIFIFLFVYSTQAQQAKPEKVYRIVYEMKSDEWYRQQAKLWKKEIEKNSKNTEAWRNYYNAVRYENYSNSINTKEKKQRLKKIVDDMGKAVPESFDYNFLKHTTSPKQRDIKYLKKAYKIDPTRPNAYYDLITHYEFEGEEKKVTEFYEKLYQSKDIASWLVNYNYNVLMTTEKNAIIFTNGDNDTYPARMLQEVKNVRRDVTVINIPMSWTESFIERIFEKKGIKIEFSKIKKKAIIVKPDNSKDVSIPVYVQELCKELTKKYPEIPIYFALTVYENFHKDIKDNLYITGLAYRYSTGRIDNLAMIKKNLENNFRLDYLKYSWYNENILGKKLIALMNTNYVPPMIMLAEHYKTSGQNEKAQYWKNMALEIAASANNKQLIQYIERKNL